VNIVLSDSIQANNEYDWEDLADFCRLNRWPSEIDAPDLVWQEFPKLLDEFKRRGGIVRKVGE